MSVQPGTNLLHYRIVDKVGEGGMGEVWRARDTTLDREVALKVLPQAFSVDADRLSRFEREAKVLASLNHPNIAGIYGLHADGSVRFLAMELVPGEDLAGHLARGPVPVQDAISFGRKIAEALEYAHEHGIVHRDLKPANIKITPDGDLKVLDFGLAKAVAGDPEMSGSSQHAASIATMTSPAMTQAGIILGTAAYMSPEQARGRPVDKRTDNWAFGCVLYEMLTGERIFAGDTVTDVIAAVVTREPDWSRLPASTPDSLRHLLRRCLDKDSRTRLRDIGEARIILNDPGASEVARVRVPSAWPSRLGIGAVAAALVAGLVIGRYMLVPEPPPPQAFEFDVTVPDLPLETGSFALSPDGSRLALVVRDSDGDRQLAVRELSRAEVRLLPGTTGALYPFWSPDGRAIAYFSGEQLNWIPVAGGGPRPVADVLEPRGGAWTSGDILLVGSAVGPIQKVPVAGGTPEAVTEIKSDLVSGHMWPAALPDGKRFVFMTDSGADEGHGIWLGSLDGSPASSLKTLLRSQGILDPEGRLLVSERGQLVAYEFDMTSGQLSNESTLLAADVNPIGDNHQLPVSVADGPTLAFQITRPETRIAFLDQAGRVTRLVGRPGRYGNVAISSDQKYVAYEAYSEAAAESIVWAEDVERGVRIPLSMRGKLSDSATWSGDGQAVYFESNLTGDAWDVYRMPLSGAGGVPESLGHPEGTRDAVVLDVSPDDRWLIAYALTRANKNDLWVLDLQAGPGAWKLWFETAGQELSAAFSPDSRWIAYTSDVSGRNEVYLAPFEGGPSASRWQISASGGFEPKFSPDGKTVYYRSTPNDWVAVDVDLGNGSVQAGTPRILFRIPLLEQPFVRNFMDVLPDGSGFLGLQATSNTPPGIWVRVGR